MEGAVRNDNGIGTGSIPKMAGLAGFDTTGSVAPAFGMAAPNGHTHEVVKEAVMDSRFSLPASLVLLCGLTALGPVPAEAAGIGVHVRVHAQNMPQAVAREHSPHVGVEMGAQAPSRLNPNTRSIQLDTAGESAAIKSHK